MLFFSLLNKVRIVFYTSDNDKTVHYFKQERDDKTWQKYFILQLILTMSLNHSVWQLEKHLSMLTKSTIQVTKLYILTFIKKISLILMRMYLAAGANFSLALNFLLMEQEKVNRLAELSEQFVTADKYVFVTPMWNFSFPPVMKAYLDSVAVAGKSFKYTAEGPVGLLTDKKALHIQARGGIYSEGPAADMEMGHRYIGIMMNFFEYLR